jgi:RNA polymerase sigma factor (sigma-70 family)
MSGPYETPRGRGGRSVYSLYVADARYVNREPRVRNGSDQDLVESHLFYVIQVAREYRNLGIPLEDLMAEGNLGLMEAAGRFDRTRGVKFISYATWWIRKRIMDLVSRQASLVRMPKYRLEKLRMIRAVERELRGLLGRNPTVEEIARSGSMTVAEVEALGRQSQREISLDTVVNIESGMKLEEIVAERASCPPDAGVLGESDDSFVVRYLEHLPRRQREILSLHFGLGGCKAMTLAEIGRRLGISRERVRQLERQGLVRLRRLMETGGRHFATG